MSQPDNNMLQFTQNLAAEINGDDLELPGFPDAVNQIQIALTDPNVSLMALVDLIVLEPVLTAKLMRVASSAAYNASGKEIGSLGAAVSRLGFNAVRSTAITFAMQQMQHQDWLAPIKDELNRIWRASNEVGAIGHVISKQGGEVQPDQALLAGLLHQIGRLYILLQVQKGHESLRQESEFHDTVATSQAAIGQKILVAWNLPKPICESLVAQDQLLERGGDGFAPLDCILAAAKLRNRLATEPDFRELHPEADDVLGAIQVSGQSFVELVANCHDEIETMRQILA